MPHPASAVYVMIASPSDVSVARDVVQNALIGWNETNTRSKGVALIPLRWETSTVPMLGASPQAIINQQLVDQADIVIALFGSRLGTVTDESASGTAEEIARAEAAGKPIHLYFSTAPHPHDVEPEQLIALRDFKAELESRGLLGTFGNAEELSARVWQAIEHDISIMIDSQLLLSGTPTGQVQFSAQPGVERYPHSTDTKGRVKYRTRRWVDLTNQGAVDAESVTFSASPGVFLGLSGPTVVHAGQTRRIPIDLSFGASEDATLTVRWVDDEERTAEFHIG